MPESPEHGIVKTHFAALLDRRLQTAITDATTKAAEGGQDDLAASLEALHELLIYSTELEIRTLSSSSTGISGSKVPDIGVCYDEDPFPPMVAEVARSQKSMDLARLARSYISGSNGAIRTVLTIDLDYMQGKRKRSRAEAEAEDGSPQPGCSCVCLYRMDKRVMWNEVFREPDGTERDGEIKLSLADFVPEAVVRRIGRQVLEDATVVIPFSQLNAQLRRGEKRQLALEKSKTQEQRGGRKRLRFDWDLPEEDASTHVESSGDDDGGEGPSKKRRLSPSQKTFRGSTQGSTTLALAQRPSARVTRSRSRGRPTCSVVTRSRSRANSQA